MSTDLVTIQSFEFIQQAEAAKELLEHHGLRAFVVDKNTISMNWLLGNAVGYVKLQVSAAEAETAVALLQERQETPTSRTGAQDDARVTACLACGADIPASRRDCPSCGWSYDAGADIPAEEGTAIEDESEYDDQPGALDTFRSTKRAVFLLLLTPVIAAIAALGFGAIALVVWIVQTILHR
jgi:hypothetical protein